MTETDVHLLGWTKARLIAATKSNKETSRSAVTFSKTSTVTELIAYLATGDTVTNRITKSFRLTQAESDELESALLQAGASVKGGRYTNRSEAFMKMVRVYAQMAMVGRKPALRLAA